MKRRHFLALSALSLGTFPAWSETSQTVDFTPEAYKEALESGKPLLLDFTASWWPVCRSQERTVSALIENNEAYRAVTVMKVDWDKFRGEPITKELNVRRQATLVMFNDGKEVDRLISQTSADIIRQLFDKAVAG